MAKRTGDIVTQRGERRELHNTNPPRESRSEVKPRTTTHMPVEEPAELFQGFATGTKLCEWLASLCLWAPQCQDRMDNMKRNKDTNRWSQIQGALSDPSHYYSCHFGGDTKNAKRARSGTRRILNDRAPG